MHQLIFILNDCIRNTTAVCTPRQSPRQNSGRDKFSLRKNWRKYFLLEKIICLGLTVTKVSCLGEINVYHDYAICTYRNKFPISVIHASLQVNVKWFQCLIELNNEVFNKMTPPMLNHNANKSFLK